MVHLFLQHVCMLSIIYFASICETSHIYISNAETPHQAITMDVFPNTRVSDVRAVIVKSLWPYDVEVAAIKYSRMHLSDHELLSDVGVCSESTLQFYTRKKVVLNGHIDMFRDKDDFEDQFIVSVALDNPNFFGVVISEIKKTLKSKNDGHKLFKKWDIEIPTLFQLVSKRESVRLPVSESGCFVLDPDIESVRLINAKDYDGAKRNGSDHSIESRRGFGGWSSFRHRIISQDTLLADMAKVSNPVNIWYPNPVQGNRLNTLSGLLDPYFRVTISLHEGLSLLFEKEYRGPYMNLFQQVSQLNRPFE